MSLIALSAVGQQNKITTDSDYTLFKSKIYRPASFSLEAKKIDFNSGAIRFGNTINAQITYSADLLTKLYFVVELNKSEQDSALWDQANGKSFVSFVNDIGHAMIKTATLEIGAVNHNQFSDVYLHTRENYIVGEDKKSTELTGRTWDGAGLPLELEKMAFENHQFWVELPFWFTRDWSNALPLVASHLSESKVKIELRKKTELLSAVNSGTGDFTTALDINDMYLIGEYVFLPDAQRHAYAKLRHWFLIEDVQEDISSMESGKSIVKQRLSFNHMVKELQWMVRSDANKAALEWYNFAGPEDGTSIGAPANEGFKDASIYFNNNERLMAMSPIYFRVVQPKQHHAVLPREPVYSYSFALKPDAHAPSGTVNFSRIENIELRLNFTAALADNYELIVIAKHYNLVSVQNGIVSLSFSS